MKSRNFTGIRGRKGTWDFFDEDVGELVDKGEHRFADFCVALALAGLFVFGEGALPRDFGGHFLEDLGDGLGVAAFVYVVAE